MILQSFRIIAIPDLSESDYKSMLADINIQVEKVDM